MSIWRMKYKLLRNKWVLLCILITSLTLGFKHWNKTSKGNDVQIGSLHRPHKNYGVQIRNQKRDLFVHPNGKFGKVRTRNPADYRNAAPPLSIDTGDPTDVILGNFPSLGEANLIQYQESRKRDLSIRTSASSVPSDDRLKYKHASYHVRYTFNCRDRSKLYVMGKMNETKEIIEDDVGKQVRTTGGSSFIVTIHSEQFGTSTCTIADLNNGQYTWLCPFAEDACANVQVILGQTNFEAFRHFSTFIGEKRYEKTFCMKDIYRHKYCAFPNTPKFGTWKGNVFKSQSPPGLEIDVSDSFQAKDLCGCMSSFVQVHAFGQISDELIGDCLIQLCSEASNVIFRTMDQLSSFASESQSRKKVKNEFLMIHLGMWDLYSRGVEFAMEEYIEELIPILGGLIPVFGAKNIAILSTTATPQTIKTDMRNNAILGALSQVQRGIAQELGIGFIDLYEPTVILYKKGIMYMDIVSYVANADGTCEKTIAYAIFAKILDYMCTIF